MKDTDIAYLAGIVDGEGGFSIRHVTIDRGRSVNWFKYTLRITMLSRAVIEKCKSISGLGTISKLNRVSSSGKDIWQWQVNGRHLVLLCEHMLPYLVEKQEQAQVILELASTMNKYGDSRVVSGEIITKRIELKNRLHSLTL